MKKVQKFASSIFDVKYIDKMDCYQVVNKNLTTRSKLFSYKLISLCNEPEILIADCRKC